CSSDLIGACYVATRRWGTSPGAKGGAAGEEGDVEPPHSRAVEITRAEVTNIPVRELWPTLPAAARNVVAARLVRQGQQQIVTGATTFALGDVVTLVGSADSLDQVVPHLGVPSDV